MNSSTGLRVVIDTNVLISGIYWKGIPRKIVGLWKDGKLNHYVSPGSAAEMVNILVRFGMPKEKIKKIKNLLVNNSVKVIPKQEVKLCRDPKDNQFLELCLDASADYLITGDKDLLSLKKFGITQILTPKQFWGKIEK